MGVAAKKKFWETIVYVIKPGSFEASSVMHGPLHCGRERMNVKCNAVRRKFLFTNRLLRH